MHGGYWQDQANRHIWRHEAADTRGFTANSGTIDGHEMEEVKSPDALRLPATRPAPGLLTRRISDSGRGRRIARLGRRGVDRAGRGVSPGQWTRK